MIINYILLRRVAVYSTPRYFLVAAFLSGGITPRLYDSRRLHVDPLEIRDSTFSFKYSGEFVLDSLLYREIWAHCIQSLSVYQAAAAAASTPPAATLLE